MLAHALKAALRTADLYVSPDLLAEYHEVPERLRRKFARTKAVAHRFARSENVGIPPDVSPARRASVRHNVRVNGPDSR